MTISAISSNYSYFQKYQDQFFGGTISVSQFEFLMRKYGVKESGDTYKDVQALYQAMYASADSEVIAASTPSIQNQPKVQKPSQATDAQNSSNVPWASLMGQVGLTVTGDLDKDYAAFTAKISTMQASAAQSPKDQAMINQLIAEAGVVFVQQDQSSTQATSQSQSNAQTPSVSGVDILAQLNRMYFFGG